MKIKTYHTESVPQALEEIKKELGPGAVILSTKKAKRRKFLGLVPSLSYAITAASEEVTRGTGLDLGPGAAKREPTAGPASNPAIARAAKHLTGLSPVEPGRSRTPFRPEFEKMARRVERMAIELGEVKHLMVLRKPLSVQSRTLFGDGLFQQQFESLVKCGFDESLAYSLLQDLRRKPPVDFRSGDQLSRCLNQRLAEMIETAPIATQKGVRGAIFFGPTGVGKTTTIAKLAARFALGEGRKVHLITLDTYRIAAAEQLKIYGEIIGVPVTVVSSIPELGEAVHRSQERDFVLIDTAGHSHRSFSKWKRLSSFLRRERDIEKHLVLSLTTNFQDLNEMIYNFEVCGVDKLLFTKLDESSAFGTIANQLIRTGKPLSYLTNGQKVPDDLQVPTVATVANLVVPLN
ncbi:MAG: flagellar biosynthesis protein FlhF [Acidobacteriota bacterium]